MAKSDMIGMKSFKEKREAFFITLKEDIKPKDDMETKEEIQLIDINRKKFTAKKSARENSTEEKRKATRKRFFKSVATLAAVVATSAVLGVTIANKFYEKYEDEKSITLEQALRKGKTAQDLAISEETLEKIENMNEIFQQDLTYEEMLEVVRKFPIIQESMLKEKIAAAVSEEVTEEDIKLSPFNGVTSTNVRISGKNEEENYESENPINQILGKGISKDIIKYIEEIAEAQGMEEDFKANKIGMEEAKAFYQKAMKRMQQVVAWEITTDEKGNIGVEKMNQLELELEVDDDLEL